MFVFDVFFALLLYLLFIYFYATGLHIDCLLLLGFVGRTTGNTDETILIPSLKSAVVGNNKLVVIVVVVVDSETFELVLRNAARSVSSSCFISFSSICPIIRASTELDKQNR